MAKREAGSSNAERASRLRDEKVPVEARTAANGNDQRERHETTDRRSSPRCAAKPRDPRTKTVSAHRSPVRRAVSPWIGSYTSH